VRRIGLIAAVAMTLMLAASPSLASYGVTRTTTARAAPASATTWWLDSTWVSPQMGWVLGEGQAGCPSCVVVRYTGDGGITWSALPVPLGRPRNLASGSYGCLVHGCVSQIVFANPEDGYLFGPDLYTTTDGGRSWHRQAGRPTLALVSVAPGVVWRLTYTHGGCPGPCGVNLLQQRAGASTWTTVRAPFDGIGVGVTPQLVSTDSARVLVVFYGNIAGGVVNHAFFYITTNLGRSWSIRADPCGGSFRTEKDAVDASAAGPNLVVECMAKGDSNTRFILASHDGGNSFGPRRPIPRSFAFMVAAVGANTIVLATGGVFGGGPDTYIVETSTNGGASWRTVLRDQETLISSMPGASYLAFVTPTVGHWIGFGNKLWTTTDGGEHWTASNV
jgi:photosystem II stability/assembly factor-like uncharacterized protein